jgi:hypothetical protein
MFEWFRENQEPDMKRCNYRGPARFPALLPHFRGCFAARIVGCEWLVDHEWAGWSPLAAQPGFHEFEK